MNIRRINIYEKIKIATKSSISMVNIFIIIFMVLVLRDPTYGVNEVIIDNSTMISSLNDTSCDQLYTDFVIDNNATRYYVNDNSILLYYLENCMRRSE